MCNLLEKTRFRGHLMERKTTVRFKKVIKKTLKTRNSYSTIRKLNYNFFKYHMDFETNLNCHELMIGHVY